MAMRDEIFSEFVAASAQVVIPPPITPHGLASEEGSARSTDAMVAEKVMGWGEVHLDKDPGGAFDFWVGRPPGEQWFMGLAAYSTDIAAAWEVVEHLRAQDLGITVYAYQDGFSARVGLMEEIWASSAPEAICAAALAAIAVASRSGLVLTD